ncbi:MAG: hypothetical protein ACXWB2_06270, partial [Acidimicrobiales bacterium]
MNRKQLLVVGVVVGLLLVGWMLGQRDYELHRRLTVSWARDPSPTGELIPWSAPASPPVDATIGCSGPLRPPDERLDVRSPGWAPTSFDGQHPIYLEPNPCIAERSARRRTLMLGAVAVL